jgi:hypothetical protein
MNKLDGFLSTHGSKVIIALLVLVYFKSCGIDSEVERVKKDLRATEQRLTKTNQEIDTLTAKVISEELMIELIKTVPAWKTLRIEEISDKERISINALEEKNK